MTTKMLTSTTLSPKALAAALLATVTPYLTILLVQYADTGTVDAANWRNVLVAVASGLLTFLAAYLAAPGKVVTVLDPDEAERFGIVGSDGPHL